MSDTPEINPTIPTQSSKCQGCLYWKQQEMPMGECMALPPVFVGPAHNVQQRRPITKNTDLCMYWLAK